MFGLTDWQDNKEWSGIFNHSVLSARYSVHFAQQLQETEYSVNAQQILDGMIVSHTGRRQWDEAGWYPEVIPDAEKKRTNSNETLGLKLIQGKVPQDVFGLVSALGHNVEEFSVDPSVYNSLEYKLTSYVDHRTTQQYESLHTRMGDFLLGNFFDRDQITDELKQNVYSAMDTIIERRKNYQLGLEEFDISLDKADEIANILGAKSDSPRLARRDLMQLILQDADTEAMLIHEGIDPDNITEKTVPMPQWEDKLRQDYVASARESIIDRVTPRLEELANPNTNTASTVINSLNNDFPANTLWGHYARELITQTYY